MSSSSKNSIRSLRSKNLKRENCCPNLNNLSISNSKTSRHLHSVAQSNSSTTPVYPNGLNPNLVDEIPEPLNVSKQTKFLDLKNKNLTFLPAWLIKYRNLTHLDLSNNCLTLNEHDINILRFCGRNLEQLNLNKNKIKNLSLRFDNLQNRPNLPMLFGSVLRNLKFLDLSSNKITDFEAVTGCQNLEKLQLSGNEIEFLPENLNLMKNLVYLYLGFNKMTFLSDAISNLTNLRVLAINNNKLTSLYPNLQNLSKLQTFHLHNNQISSLPRILVNGLPNLKELSLRNNPLIDKFVRKRMNEGRKHTAPTLFELACRNIKMHNIPYTEKDFTPRIINYLNMARKCPNPNCCGVYFDDKYVQVKFVDTCGAYRLPLLQYLCSPNCFEPSDPATSSFSSSSANNSDAGSESEEVVSVVPGSSSRLVPNTLNEVTDLSRRVIIGGHGVTTEELVNGDFRSRV